MSNVLANILKSQRKHFNVIAETWLNTGASAFTVWADGALLARWAGRTTFIGTPIIAPIYLGATQIGELRVFGTNLGDLQMRIETDAHLISHMAHLEQNLDGMTSRLIDTQDQLLALYDLTRATRNYLDITDLLQQLAKSAVRLVKTKGAFVLLDTPEKTPWTAHYPNPILPESDLRLYLQQLQASSHEEALYWDKVLNNMGEHSSLLMIPIEIRGSVIAALGLLDKTKGEFTSPDRKLALAIAEHAGAQIENVLLFQANLEQTRLETEMKLAQRVQLQLLPQNPPSVEGLELWAESQPASRVGGDFYDFIVKKNQPLTFAVGDISGKGMPAALLMAMTRTVLRTQSNTLPVPTPETLMRRSNEDLYDDFTEVSMFATVFIGQYSPRSRQLIYANAGHSPVIYCPAGQSAYLLEADGAPIGILPTSLSLDQHMNFKAGDVLVIATDGLNEARNSKDDMFGYDKLLRLIESLAHKSAAEIAEALYSAVARFSDGTMQDDDQTMIVMKGMP